ncbi:MAG: DUF983 domain-containing protein [Acidimicrobiia bacterium]|nr:DUF983 domain-containing protein [Acidimicrobiia bacterium]
MTATPLRMLARGAAKRCARCGSGGLFTRWFRIAEDCPRCGLHFEREEGYWTGAMMINLAVTEVVFLALFVGLAVAWWPDPPWGRMFVILVTVNALLPIAFYPFSKTLWIAGDLSFRSLTREPD